MADARVPGSCFCGAIRFRIGLPTLFCGHCHCSMCRRSHGAAFVTWLAVPRGRFRLEAGEGQLRRFRSSEHGTRSFCSRCGSSLFCESSRHPDQVDVVLANMHGPIDRLPQVHVHFDDRAEWLVPEADLPRLGGETGLEPIGPEGESKQAHIPGSRVVHESDVPVRSGPPVDEEHADRPGLRPGKHEAQIGKAVGLTQFGVNLVTLDPGGSSALRHWHQTEDELVYVLSGEVTLIDDDGEHPLVAGSAVGFPAGNPNAHHIVNRSAKAAAFLAIGSRRHGEEVVHYPDDGIGPIRK